MDPSARENPRTTNITEDRTNPEVCPPPPFGRVYTEILPKAHGGLLPPCSNSYSCALRASRVARAWVWETILRLRKASARHVVNATTDNPAALILSCRYHPLLAFSCAFGSVFTGGCTLGGG